MLFPLIIIDICYLADSVEKNEVPELVIKEWLWSKSNQYETPNLVRAEEIGWAVPTIQRLWFGLVGLASIIKM